MKKISEVLGLTCLAFFLAISFQNCSQKTTSPSNEDAEQLSVNDSNTTIVDEEPLPGTEVTNPTDDPVYQSWSEVCTAPPVGAGTTNWANSISFDGDQTVTISTSSLNPNQVPTQQSATHNVTLTQLDEGSQSASGCLMVDFASGLNGVGQPFVTKLAYCLDGGDLVVKQQSTNNGVAGPISSGEMCRKQILRQ